MGMGSEPIHITTRKVTVLLMTVEQTTPICLVDMASDTSFLLMLPSVKLEFRFLRELLGAGGALETLKQNIQWIMIQRPQCKI